jgi:hypothetical protein
MCFLLVEGFHKTKNIKKYIQRMVVFAIIAQIPYAFFMGITEITIGSFNFLFNLCSGLILMLILQKCRQKTIKILGIIGCFIVSFFCDWTIFGLLFILGFYLNYGKIINQLHIFADLSLVCFIGYNILFFFQGGNLTPMFVGLFLTIPILAMYNGEKSRIITPKILCNKYLFYCIYPLQFIFISLLKFLIF